MKIKNGGRLSKKLKIIIFVFCVLVFAVGAFFVSKKYFKLGKSKVVVNKGVVIDNQLALPQPGEQIAAIYVKDYGNGKPIRCRLFKDAAPKAVENFIGLAKAKKYDGVEFDRVISDFMIQGGGDSQSIFGKPFEVEINSSLHHYNGALCAARTSSLTEGQTCQFYIVCSDDGRRANFDYLEQNFIDELDDELKTIVKKYGKFKFAPEVRKKYGEVGGYPFLDGKYTVFGQVFDGFEIVSQISNCPKEADTLLEEPQPDPPVIIEKIEIQAWQG